MPNKIQSKTIVPVFPLPNVVFFPKTLLPLHIFEPRYRKMTADALAGANQIVITLLKDGWEQDYFGSPDVHEIACVGEIQYSEKLDDGKFNLLLYGTSRVKIVDFVQEHPYRTATVQPLKDAHFDHDSFNEKAESERFLEILDHYLSAMGVTDAGTLLNLNSHSFEAVVNQAASALDLTTREKQELLELGAVELRYEKLKTILSARLVALNIAKKVRFVPKDPTWN
ncbi:MAG TPA: LON peptidase substrate-binding domain-containing protein [bacterium]